MKNNMLADNYLGNNNDSLFKDDYSTQSNSNLSFNPIEKNERNYIKLNHKSYSYVFPLVYFFSSTLFLFIILFVNIYKERDFRNNFEKMPMSPFPGFIILKEIQPKVYATGILIISISGFLNVWFFCSLLLQRFSVPELRKSKITVHLMFILGIFGNIIYLFFGFSPELLNLEVTKIKVLKISLSMIIFLSFVFFNTLFATLTLNVFENFKMKIAPIDNRLKRNINIKKYVVYLTIFIMFIYIFSIVLNYETYGTKIKSKHKNKTENNNFLNNFFVKKFIHFFLFVLPYILFVLNAIINLTYYFDIRYIDDIINMIIDREFFLTNEESTLLLSQFPLDNEIYQYRI